MTLILLPNEIKAIDYWGVYRWNNTISSLFLQRRWGIIMSAASRNMITYTNILEQGCKAARDNYSSTQRCKSHTKKPWIGVFYIKNLPKSCLKDKSNVKLFSSNEQNFRWKNVYFYQKKSGKSRTFIRIRRGLNSLSMKKNIESTFSFPVWIF